MNSKVASQQGRTMLDARLAAFRPLDRGIPRSGWVRAVRDALGMTTRQMGQRLGVSAAAISQLEKSERQGTIQLDTLRRAAEALDCSLFYVLVPRESLEATVNTAALERATERIVAVDRTMRLEQQGLPKALLRERAQAAAKVLVESDQVWRNSGQ